jgi:RNA polymerase primary sigma factor
MDDQTRRQLVEKWDGLARKISRQLYRISPCVRQIGTHEDVLQVARLALLKAADHYNPDHTAHASFVTYAWHVISQQIRREARQAGFVRVPEWTWKHTDTENSPETTKTLACAAVARRMRRQRLIYRPSRRAPHDDDYGGVFDEAVHDWPEPTCAAFPLSSVEALELLHVLPPRQQQIVQLHYGLTGERALSFRAVGIRLGVSGERARQLHQRALIRLKHEAWRLADWDSTKENT